MATELLSIVEIVESQASKYVTHNTALRQLEGQLIRALDRDLTAPPGSPANGDTYIVATGGSGAWAGKDKYIAHWFGGAWSTYAPKEGHRLWLNDEDIEVVYDGTNWVSLADPTSLTQPHIVALFIPGLPAASATVFVHYVTEAFTLPASLTGSKGGCEVAATAQTVFSLRKNGTEFGTATVAASGTTVTFAAASQTSFASGDKLSVVSPAQDATLADLGISLKGTR